MSETGHDDDLDSGNDHHAPPTASATHRTRRRRRSKPATPIERPNGINSATASNRSGLTYVGPPRRRSGLSGMLLVELRELADELGVTGVAGLRKGDLIAAIKEQQGRSVVRHPSKVELEDAELEPETVEEASDEEAPELESETVQRTSPVPVGRVASQMTGWATRLLPDDTRARYEEEFNSELYYLAADGVSRWRQAVHAVRLLTRSIPLRMATKAAGERAL